VRWIPTWWMRLEGRLAGALRSCRVRTSEEPGAVEVRRLTPRLRRPADLDPGDAPGADAGYERSCRVRARSDALRRLSPVCDSPYAL